MRPTPAPIASRYDRRRPTGGACMLIMAGAAPCLSSLNPLSCNKFHANVDVAPQACGLRQPLSQKGLARGNAAQYRL